jgi:hypothetical protein
VTIQEQAESIIQKLRDDSPVLRSFDKYVGQDQRHMADYERGVTHAVNAFIPVMAELVARLAEAKVNKVAQLSGLIAA